MEGGSGSRIVVSIRSEVVGKITATATIIPYSLKGLSESESLSLLKKIAKPGPDPELETIGEMILECFSGVPLAIKTIGGLLFLKPTKLEWSNVLENITQHGITGVEPILRLSYDYLPSHLKQCFAYCSLFPKDYEINKHDLTNLWMAQGFIQSSGRGQSLEDVGHDYFMNLLLRSFFQEVEEDKLGNIESCKMHDLATSVAGTECCLTNIVDDDVENVDENTRHLSLFLEESDSSWEIPTSFLKANKIRTFFWPNSRWYSLSEPNSSIVIRSFKCLRMLSLKKTDLEKLPHSICRLKHLRYLDLSHNDNIRELPNCVTRLQNLQTLDLRDCGKLVELPSEIENMVSLKHLLNKGCYSLKHMPVGVGQLSSLTTLDWFVVGRLSRQIGKLRELGRLNNLRGQLEIKGLENATPDESGDSCLKEKSFLESLTLRWDVENEGGNGAGNVNDDDDEMVLESLRPHPNIKELEVCGYNGAKFSNWLSPLTDLVNIDISDCSNCRYLPVMDHLPSLKFLTLWRLDALEHVSETVIDTSSATTFFPALETLRIFGCPNLKGWWSRNNTSDEDEDKDEDEDEASSTSTSTRQNLLPSFPRLSTLIIRECPKLIEFHSVVPNCQ